MKSLKKLVGSFTLHLGKVCRKSVEFQNKFRERLKSKNFRIIKSKRSKNHRDQHFEKMFTET